MSSILRKMTHKNPEKKFIYKVIFVLLVILIPGGRSNDGEKDLGALQTSDGESLESRQEDLDVNKIINGALVAINLAMALAAVAASIQGNMTTTTTTPRTHREVTGGHRRTTPRHRPIVAHLDTDARYLFVEPVTQLGKYPWVTRLTCHNMFVGSTTCFGVLVSRNAVLTSAQCVKMQTRRHGGIFGPLGCRTLIGGTTEPPRHGSQEVSRHVVPQDVVVHSKFDELTLANDVALVKLRDPLNDEPRIVLDNYSDQNLKLLPSDSADGKLAMLAWGTGNYGSNYLKTSQTGLIDADKCMEKLKEVCPDCAFNPEIQVCYYGLGTMRQCSESPGGPLIEENGSETALVSIHSYTAVGNHSENNIRYDGGHRDNCLLAGSCHSNLDHQRQYTNVSGFLLQVFVKKCNKIFGNCSKPLTNSFVQPVLVMGISALIDYGVHLFARAFAWHRANSENGRVASWRCDKGAISVGAKISAYQEWIQEKILKLT